MPDSIDAKDVVELAALFRQLLIGLGYGDHPQVDLSGKLGGQWLDRSRRDLRGY